MRLTREEFGQLKMDYSFGINTDSYCARRYESDRFGITKEVVTERAEKGNIYSGFKEPDVCWYRGKGKTYDTADQLYEGEFLTPWFQYDSESKTDWLPVRPGWYEIKWGDSETGMAWWSGGCWYTDEHMSRLIAVTTWRGMLDVEEQP